MRWHRPIILKVFEAINLNGISIDHVETLRGLRHALRNGHRKRTGKHRIDLNGSYLCPRFKKSKGQRTQPGPDLNDLCSFANSRVTHDAPNSTGIMDKVLSQGLCWAHTQRLADRMHFNRAKQPALAGLGIAGHIRRGISTGRSHAPILKDQYHPTEFECPSAEHGVP